MKCITCAQEIPDTSTTCPFCNNKVEPLVSASEALGVNNTQVIPNTPSDFVLPKDQQEAQTGVIEVVQPTNIPSPPPMENIPSPPKMDETPVQPTAPTVPVEDKGQNRVQPPEQPVEQGIPAPDMNNPTYVDPTSFNLEGVDLNSNKNLESGYTGISGTKEASTVQPKEDEEKLKKKKLIRLLIVTLFICILGGGGLYFYITQFQSSDKRIDAVVDKIFAPIKQTNNSKIEEGSGTYKLHYNLSKNDDELTIESNGKYAYNLPNKKIDLIANFSSINHNGELLSEELNTELYLESNRAYFLLQNFSNQYIYTDIDKSYETIQDIESRFDQPEELLLFKLVDSLYNNGLDDFSKDYQNYINNISQNDINFMNILNGISGAIKATLKKAPKTQKFENNNNVIKISLISGSNNKGLLVFFIEELSNNKNAWSELAKLYGKTEADLKQSFRDKIDSYEFNGIDGNIVITTKAFKNSLISLKFPLLKDGKVYATTVVPVGSGYKMTQYLDGNEVTNITYSKAKSSTSQTNTVTYTLKGSMYINNVANNLDMSLELVKDINPNKINVITRNSLDYQYVTANDHKELADKFKSFGNLGVVFNSHYVGDIDEPTEPTEETNVENTPTE